MKLRRAHRERCGDPDALTFMAGDRSHVEEAYPGDILGLHNHGTIQIGDTLSVVR